MLVGVEQNDRVGQNVDGISILEEVGALLVVVLAERLHDAVDLLCLARQAEALKVQPHRRVKLHACPHVRLSERLQLLRSLSIIP